MLVSYAYRNSSRDENSLIYAKDCTAADIGKRFYCPNPDCTAHMYLCNFSGNNDIAPYFRATRKAHPHVDGCFYAKISVYDTNLEKYNELEFDFEKATLNVMKPSKTGQSTTEKKPVLESRKLPPHTIKQIYELAISHDINFSYNGFKMWQLLADRRSAHIYKKGIRRSCLVECVFAGFNKTKKYIRMKYFYNKENCHYLKLYFLDEEVFNKAINTILPERKNPIIIWGYWREVEYFYKTIVYSLNQIYVPKLHIVK